MQVSVENTGSLERRLTVQVPDQEIQDKINDKLREMSKQVRIKGFRPGRVPMSVVKQRYGKQVRNEIIGQTMQQSLQQAIQDENIRPASMPRLDSEPHNVDGGNLEFTAVVEVYPEIGDLNVGDLDIVKPQAEVEESDVDEMLETLRLQRRTWNPVERKAEAGDQVLMEYSAEAKEGRVPEEGAERLAIIMGDSGFEDLEKAVAKIEPGESSNIKLKFPDNFRNSALAGQKAKVELKVVTVSESVIPEVDEEFITSFGVEDGTLDTLKEEIRGNLERELKQAMNTILKTRLIDALVASRADLDVPAGMVRDEASNMAMQIAARQGLEQPDPAIAQQLMGEAEKRVRAGLLMGELAQQNSIRIDGSKVRETIESIASTYEQSAEVVQMYYGNQQLLQQVESSVLEEQVVDWALENAKVTPEPMKFQDVITTATQAARGQ